MTGSYRVLVVDDEMELVMAIKIRLESAGYTVSCAYDGKQAIEMCAKNLPDLVVLDVSMPVMDGYTTLRDLRMRHNREALPVIILTAKGRMRDLFDLEGIDDYVVKPFEHDDLLLRVNRILKPRQDEAPASPENG